MGLFDKLESKLEQGVNGAFARAFKSEVQPVEIAAGIRRAMDDRAASVGKGKRPIVPNLFTIELSPTDYDRLAAWGDDLDDELIASAQEHADEQRYMPGGPLTIVLSESDSLETGVFRLRPATAKAADALAHQRSHPRPQPGASNETGSGRSGEQWSDADARWDERPATTSGGATRAGQPSDDANDYDDGYDDEHRSGSDHAHEVEGSGRAGAAAGAAGTVGGAKFALPGAGTQRPFGARVKEYLLGGYASEPARAGTPEGTSRGPVDDRTDQAPSDRHDADSWQRDDASDDADRHGYTAGADPSGYADRDHEAGHGYATDDDDPDANRSYASGHDDAYRAADHDAPAYGTGEYGAGEYGTADDYAAGHEPAPRSAAAAPARTSHGWDDDDSDYGDPTGYEPAPAPREPHARRAMSPRERPWLKIDGQRYPLLGAITVLGRDDDADIVIDDPGVSRRHSEVRITHDGPHLVMSVRDLGSTNGTYVNGDLIDSAHVRDGDRLTLGRTPMTIHLGDRP